MSESAWEVLAERKHWADYEKNQARTTFWFGFWMGIFVGMTLAYVFTALFIIR